MNEEKQKLDWFKTIKIGCAFLSISAFWQLYNGVIPPILTGTFSFNSTFSGVIMAMDNVLALFLLPLFGMLSDRCKSPLGRRKPFILSGTIAAVLLMQLIPFLDNQYADSGKRGFQIAFIIVLFLLLIAMGTYRSPAVALMPDVTPKPLRSRGNAIINLMGALGAVIYLVITTLLYSGEAFTDEKGHTDYTLLFVIVAALMVISLAVIMLFVREPVTGQAQDTQLLTEAEEQTPAAEGTGEMSAEAASPEEKHEKLPKPVLKSLILLLISIAFWFMAYNAIETWYTTYAGHVWGMKIGNASGFLTVTTIGMIIAFIPAAMLASKIGRKKTILIGLAAEVVTFFSAFLYTLAADRHQLIQYVTKLMKQEEEMSFFRRFLSLEIPESVLFGASPGEDAVYATGVVHPSLFVLFALLGIAWALINVNSLPMVVDMCADADVGRYTGYYYTFSMAAQTVTPILSGFLLDKIGYGTLFLYGALFMGIAMLTMSFVRHGDTVLHPVKPGLEMFEDM